jgi:DNA-directed RNA polymerase specialized sigma24 family protein
VQVETQLLLAARAGDPKAMHALLATLRVGIQRYAMYRCGRATSIEDVVQEALIVINRSISTVENLSSFAGWIAKVVTRLCLLPPLQLLRATDSLLQLERSPSFLARSPDGLRLDVARALESLSETQREVILMRDFEELTIGEMATRLGLTREATKSRLHRARMLMREYLTTGDHADADAR